MKCKYAAAINDKNKKYNQQDLSLLGQKKKWPGRILEQFSSFSQSSQRVCDVCFQEIVGDPKSEIKHLLVQTRPLAIHL